MEQQKEIYKVGDVVYYLTTHQQCIKGEVIEIDYAYEYPVKVLFDSSNTAHRFTKNGSYLKSNSMPGLSFAPYNIVNGGFTQERPLPIIDVDALVYVKFNEKDNWCMRFFSHFDGEVMYTFENQSKSTDNVHTTRVHEYSLTNPLEQ